MADKKNTKKVQDFIKKHACISFQNGQCIRYNEDNTKNNIIKVVINLDKKFKRTLKEIHEEKKKPSSNVVTHKLNLLKESLRTIIKQILLQIQTFEALENANEMVVNIRKATSSTNKEERQRVKAELERIEKRRLKEREQLKTKREKEREQLKRKREKEREQLQRKREIEKKQRERKNEQIKRKREKERKQREKQRKQRDRKNKTKSDSKTSQSSLEGFPMTGMEWIYRAMTGEKL